MNTKRWMMGVVMGGGMLSGLSGYAQAQTTQTTSFFKSYEFFDLNYDAQALGQANAYTAMASGFQALFYNPANLEANDRFRLTTYFQGEFSPGFVFDAVDSFSNIVNVFNDSTKSQVDQLKDIQTNLNTLRLNNAHARVNFALLSTWEGWGFGIHLRGVSLDTSIGPDATELYVRTMSDAAFILAKSFSFLEDHLWVGATSRVIYRASLSRNYALNDFLTNIDTKSLLYNSISEGLLLDVDVGATYYIPVLEEIFKPRVSAVLSHIGDQFLLSSTTFIPDSGGSTNLVREQMRAHFGAGMETPKWLVFQPSVSLDVRNVGIGPGDFFKHLHMGGALKVIFVEDILGGAFRGGIGQGYLTTGVTGYIWWFQLDAAYYVEEIGAQTGQNPDRRLILRLTFEAS